MSDDDESTGDVLADLLRTFDSEAFCVTLRPQLDALVDEGAPELRDALPPAALADVLDAIALTAVATLVEIARTRLLVHGYSQHPLRVSLDSTIEALRSALVLLRPPAGVPLDVAAAQISHAFALLDGLVGSYDAAYAAGTLG
jgi:hypothetical protein